MTSHDVAGDGVVERAALNFHAEILEYFASSAPNSRTTKQLDPSQVWIILVRKWL